MCVPLLGVELMGSLFCRDALVIAIIVRLLANESVSSLAAPIAVREGHADTFKVLSMLQKDRVEEPKTVVKDVVVLRDFPPGGPQMSAEVITDVLAEVVPQFHRFVGAQERSKRANSCLNCSPVCMWDASRRHCLHSPSSSRSPLARHAIVGSWGANTAGQTW